MKTKWTVATLGVALAAAIYVSGRGLAQGAGGSTVPRYTADGKLMLPEDYRDWIFVSSGLGMNYGPAGGDAPAFTNVFVAPPAYRHYLATGHWPDKTMFVLEVYSAASHGSINKQGNYQDAMLGVESEVKDESRFPEKWAYFGFGTDGKTASKIPQSNCWSCHNQNGAVENTFTQFYPTLLRTAYSMNTVKPSIHLLPGAARIQQMALEHGWAAAEPALAEVQSTDPGADILKEPALNALGYRLLSAGKTADAVSVFERVVRDHPSSANAYDSLADGYTAAGNKSKALECSEKAIDLVSKDPGLKATGRGRNIEEAARQRIAKLKEQSD